MTDLTHRGQRLLQELDGFSIEIDAERERADIILHRPPFNVISMHARDQLRAAFEALDEDERVRVIVVRATGEHFSSGGDIKGFLEASPEHVSKLAWNIAAPARCSKPVIAANRGFCFGVGFELSLACDFRIATDTTFYALPEQKLGLGRLGAFAADGRRRSNQGHRHALAPHSGQAGLRLGHRGGVRGRCATRSHDRCVGG
jgi:2-oxoglutaroyl-CoA hydrolase